MEYRGQVYFGPVLPRFIVCIIEHLKHLDHPVEVMLESKGKKTDDHNLDTTEHCLDAFRIASN